MLDRLNSISKGASLPFFVTCTLPDAAYEADVASFAKTAKVWMDTFTKRLQRVCPESCGFWRVEWKPRKSGLHEGVWFPHFHLLVWGLPERNLGEFSVMEEVARNDRETIREEKVYERIEAYVRVPDNQLTFELVRTLGSNLKEDHQSEAVVDGERVVLTASRGVVDRCHSLLESVDPVVMEHQGREAGWMAFQDWASLAWYHVVGSHDVNHLSAGVRVQQVRTWNGVMTYCAKYMAKSDKQELADKGVGRSWGIFNRKAIPWAKMIELPLDEEVGVRVRRVMRRYLERCFGRRVKRPYGVTLYCDVDNFCRLWRPPPAPDPF